MGREEMILNNENAKKVEDYNKVYSGKIKGDSYVFTV